MKDYSDWKINLDFENESPNVNPNRPWLKFREPDVPKSINCNYSIHNLVLIIRYFPHSLLCSLTDPLAG